MSLILEAVLRVPWKETKVQAFIPHFAPDCLNLHRQAAYLLLPLFLYWSKEGPGQDDLKSS